MLVQIVDVALALAGAASLAHSGRALARAWRLIAEETRTGPEMRRISYVLRDNGVAVAQVPAGDPGARVLRLAPRRAVSAARRLRQAGLPAAA